MALMDISKGVLVLVKCIIISVVVVMSEIKEGIKTCGKL